MPARPRNPRRPQRPLARGAGPVDPTPAAVALWRALDDINVSDLWAGEAAAVRGPLAALISRMRDLANAEVEA